MAGAKTTLQDVRCKACLDLKRSAFNYHIAINKKENPNFEVNKYCPKCRTMQAHVARDMRGGKAGNAAGGRKK